MSLAPVIGVVSGRSSAGAFCAEGGPAWWIRMAFAIHGGIYPSDVASLAHMLDRIQ